MVQAGDMFLLGKDCEGVPGSTDPALWEDTKTAQLLQPCKTPAERGYNCSL